MECKFKINDFEGPLDLLLHLIKDSKMDILDIKISMLTDQYLEFISDMKDLNLNVASEYLIMASELIYLKSRTMVPIDEEEVEDDFLHDKEALVNRLLEYQKYKEVTDDFKVLEEKRKEFYSKLPSNINQYKVDNISLENDVSLENLVNAFADFLKRKDSEKTITTNVKKREYSVEERSSQIRNMFKNKKRFEFFELFEEVSKPYVVVTFVSLLEMVKNNELRIVQENNFDKIYCEAM